MKSPGPDGHPPLYFQKFWSNTRQDILSQLKWKLFGKFLFHGFLVMTSWFGRMLLMVGLLLLKLS
ncbi:hypothetical protein NE237_017446 [Protea cynaroides]|uniref:Uncharacterized protein n=1 Tax=Protea cynaroides TaxID=273540 RepID=A0A9Q0K828_9MAGN|nr:hypothetical protein NE237_017446 [Protea cynaroides]